MIVKALSIHQPWAELIARGDKKFETRSWQTHHRGVILIHASKAAILEDFVLPFGFPPYHRLAHGAITAIASLTNVYKIATPVAKEKILSLFCNGSREDAYGDWSAGRYVWHLQNVIPLAPIACRGKQRLWNFDLPDHLYYGYLDWVEAMP
jgi:hypothetical protein